MSKKNKSQFNIFYFIIIFFTIISTMYLSQLNHLYFKIVSFILVFNIIIYAFININTKSQKTLLNLTGFYTIYLFFTTVGIFMLSQNNLLNKLQDAPHPYGIHI